MITLLRPSMRLSHLYQVLMEKKIGSPVYRTTDPIAYSHSITGFNSQVCSFLVLLRVIFSVEFFHRGIEAISITFGVTPIGDDVDAVA